MKEKAKYCNQCKYSIFFWPRGEPCKKGHYPRFFWPKLPGADDSRCAVTNADWGRKRRCDDFEPREERER